MERQFTAIIHLREGQAASPTLIETMKRIVRGVGDINYQPRESLLTVRYDQSLTGLADIVRTVEDCGSTVAGVAHRIDRIGRRPASQPAVPTPAT